MTPNLLVAFIALVAGLGGGFALGITMSAEERDGPFRIIGEPGKGGVMRFNTATGKIDICMMANARGDIIRDGEIARYNLPLADGETAPTQYAGFHCF